MKVGIIGAGLQARRRCPVIKASSNDELVVISSVNEVSSKALASKMGCEYAVGWRSVVDRGDLDAVIVCTPPNLHAEISIAAMESGKHVLCEKPLAKNSAEAKAMVDVARAKGLALKCGFNHRHHPAIKKAKQLVDSGAVGKPYYVRAAYGMSARMEYAKEWRSDPNVVGGGQLMEQGIHLIDLSRWFLGEMMEVYASLANFYVKTYPLEDNAFVTLRTEGGEVAFLHSSLTQWKNMFRFELFGSEGYFVVEGLGASYGTERLTFGKMEPGKPFAFEVTEFRGEDPCWLEEWKEFECMINNKKRPLDSAIDGLKAIQLVELAYDSHRTRKSMKVKK